MGFRMPYRMTSNRKAWAISILPALVMCIAAGALSTGCSEDSSTGALTPIPDTTRFAVQDLAYFAFNDQGAINSGFSMQWFELFESNYDKNCLIERYVILAPLGDTLFDVGIGSHSIGDGIIPNGDRHYARTKKIDVPDSSVAGLYELHIFYHHSDSDFHWDSTISIEANQFVDTTGS